MNPLTPDQSPQSFRETPPATERDQAPRRQKLGMLLRELEGLAAHPDAAVRREAASVLVARFEVDGARWPPHTCRFVLDLLCRLGDPRLDPFQKESWVRIPAGRYPMGHGKGERWEQPTHTIHLSADCWLGRFPVTNQEYAAFMAAKGYQQERFWDPEGWTLLHLDEQEFAHWFATLEKNEAFLKGLEATFRLSHQPRFWEDFNFNRANQPVVGVSGYEARAYCRWLTEQMNKTPECRWGEGLIEVRLPREAEWEAAARGVEGRRYPWGSDKPDKYRANFGLNLCETSPVGSHPRGQAGQLADLAGNVLEWCLDVWDEQAYANREGAVDPEVTGAGPLHVTRGGAWSFDELYGWSRYRSRFASRLKDIGFRCCLQEIRSKRQEQEMG